MTSHTFILSTLFFIVFWGFILTELSGFTSITGLTGFGFVLLDQVAFGIITVPLIIAIGFSNSPIVKGGAMAVLFGVFLAQFLLVGINPILFGLVMIPIFTAMGFAFLEAGKG